MIGKIPNQFHIPFRKNVDLLITNKFRSTRNIPFALLIKTHPSCTRNHQVATGMLDVFN